MQGIVGTAMAGVMIVAGIYIALRYSGATQTIAGGFTKSYGTVGNTFQAGPGSGMQFADTKT